MNLVLGCLLLVALVLFGATVARGLRFMRSTAREDLAEQVRRMNENTLYRRLPLLDIVESDGLGVVVRKDGSLAAGFRISGVDSYYYDPTEMNELSLRKEALFRKIPEDPNLKVSYFYRIRHDVSAGIERFYGGVEYGGRDVTRLLNENYRRFLEENNAARKFRTVDQIFVLQYKASGPFESGGLFFFLRKLWENTLAEGLSKFPRALRAALPYLRKREIIQRSLGEHEKKMAHFLVLVAELRAALGDVYGQTSPVHPLGCFDIEKILFEDLNPGLGHDPTAGGAARHTTDRFYFTDLFDNLRYVNVGGQLRRVLSLRSLPKLAMPGVFRQVYIQNLDLDIVVHYKHPHQAKKRRDIAFREKVEKQKLIDPAGTKTGALTASRAVTEAEEVLADLASGEKLVGEIAVQFVVYSPFVAQNLDELRAAERALAEDVLRLESLLRNIQGVSIYKEDVAGLIYVLDNIPFLARVEAMGREVACLSSWAAKLLSDENICPREDLVKAKVLLVTERQELYGFDPFSEKLVPNYNFLIAGAPGTGKSVFVRKLLSRFLYKQPLRILTITRGDDWDDFFTAIGGLSIQIDVDRGQVINLFDCPENQPSESFKQTLVGVLLFMAREADDGINSVMLSQALDELYRKARIVRFQPTMSDLREVLETFHHENRQVEERAKMFSVKLTNFCAGGQHGKLFDTPTHDNFYNASSSLCFDLDKLGRDSFLETVYALVLPRFIDEQVRAKDTPTIIVYDECWSFLRNEVLSRVVEANFRTARSGRADGTHKEVAL